ncbi:MAG: chromate transporter [Fusobacteriota bacterium]
MILYVKLFFEFFKIGLFSIGGGLATLPFLQTIMKDYNWITQKELLDIIAVAQSTPGPIGVNLATFVGYKTGGIPGGIIATFGLVLPSLFIITLIAHFFMQFDDDPFVRGALKGIRPAVVGLIGYVAFDIGVEQLLDLSKKVDFSFEFINIRGLILLGVLIFLIDKYKKHPVYYLGGSALVGLALKGI